MNNVKEELEALGIKTSGGQGNDEFGNAPINIDLFNTYPLEEGVEAVFVNLDQNFNYTKLCLASLYI